MNKGEFETQLNIAWDIIRQLNLQFDRIWSPSYSGAQASSFRGLNYSQVWKKCLSEQLYDFQLVDNSFFQFRVESFGPVKVGYAYYECPYRCMSYSEFILQELGGDPADVGDAFMTDYSNYIVSSFPKDTVTPLRYDYAPDDYTEGRHPASHIHFGHCNNIRVGTRHILLRPLAFLLFVIRQYYPDKWIELLRDDKAWIWCRDIRDNLDEVHANYWKELDKLEMSLD
jgi:hypothetical protein